ncbi:MAG TPA: HAMP domain-containing sensor histidine kinase, partial [Leptospiraceae bacterium]|nr:HAMP domain-containing sensor histidine kinase [Leptospiraceae bacterium]
YVEEKHKTKEGNFIWTGCYSNAWFDREGKLICILNFIVEIENRKKSEEELLKLDESKNAILNIVAHDLRSPIGGIISLIQIMLEEDDSSENRKYLELALQSGKHAINIANDILEMIQSSNIKNVLDKETTELNDFLKNCIQFQELQAKEKSIEILFSSTVDKVFSEINRDKMMRAITNLLSNATKFTKKGGKIEVSLTLKNKHPFITVKDSGIGIPKSKQPFLFEKFSIARRAGTRGEKSTGLGMFIVKEIIDRHAGKISFDSEENKGTSFYIEL